MSLWTLLVLALSLATDAFAVSVCAGISLPTAYRLQGGLRFGLWFGGFQALMPCIGYYAASYFSAQIEGYDHWIAFFLLVYLGWTMVSEARTVCPVVRDFRAVKEMFGMALATSIDALAVGVSFAFLQVDVLPASVIIGGITFGVSFAGLVFGTRIGAWGKEKAEIVGGVVLMLLGFKILLEHLGYL